MKLSIGCLTYPQIKSIPFPSFSYGIIELVTSNHLKIAFTENNFYFIINIGTLESQNDALVVTMYSQDL